MSGSDVPIAHDAAAHRFEADADGRKAFLSYRQADAKTLDFEHTFVPPELRGRGLASRLVERGLAHAREHGLTVIPSCPFVADFLRSHPEWQDVQAP